MSLAVKPKDGVNPPSPPVKLMFVFKFKNLSVLAYMVGTRS
jgi:hypothetical protein